MKQQLAFPIVETKQRNHTKLKLWGLAITWFICLLFALFQGGKMAYMLFAIVTVLVGYLYLGRWSGITKAKGQRTLLNIPHGGELEAGSMLEVEIKLNIPGFWPIPYVIMQDKLIRGNQRPHIHELSLIPDWRRRGSVIYNTAALRRGSYRFTEITCWTEDIFGFFNYEKNLSLAQSFLVLPKTVDIQRWHYFERMQRGFHHQSQITRKLRETTQINGVRDYHYGDKLTRIHWNATAKTGAWKSKEFERESMPQTLYVLDRNPRSYPNSEAFERAVSTVASLLKYGRNRVVPQGLLSHGNKPTYFELAHGGTHTVRMIRHLTEVEADAELPITEVIKRHEVATGKGLFYVMITGENAPQLHSLRQWIEAEGHRMCHFWIIDQSELNMEQPYHFHEGDVIPVKSLHALPTVLGGRRV